MSMYRIEQKRDGQWIPRTIGMTKKRADEKIRRLQKRLPETRFREVAVQV